MPDIPYGGMGSGDADVAVVRAIYEAFARRDVDAVLALVAPDAVFLPTATARILGRAEPYVGHDGIRRYFEDVGRAWEGLRLEPRDVRALAGGVVVFGTAEGRVDGEIVRRRVAWTWRLRDGLAVHMRADDLGDAPD